MAFVHVATGTGSDQDLLDLARASLAQVLARGQRFRDHNGREVVLPSIAELRAQIAVLETATGGGMATNLARYVREA